MNATFYCDESGFTGADWANPDQPMFVHGGWLVPDDQIDAVMVGIEKVRQNHRLDAAELKWRQLARRSDPAVAFREFFQLMLENLGLPFFLVAEKDFMLAAKAIETYFDPAYNHHLPMSFTSNFGIKKRLAEALLDSPPVLARFAEMLRQGEEPLAVVVREVGTAMAAHFRSAGEEEAAGVLNDFTDAGISDIQREFSVDSWRRTTTAHTFWSVIQHLETFGRPRGLEIKILHDNIVRFDGLLDLVRGVFRPSAAGDFSVVEGNILFHNMSTMSSLKLADSKDEELIQMADLLCGFVRTLFSKLRDGSALTAAESETSFDLAAIKMQWETWDSNTSTQLFEAFVRSAFAGRFDADSGNGSEPAD